MDVVSTVTKILPAGVKENREGGCIQADSG
jgi:hypothetical protein